MPVMWHSSKVFVGLPARFVPNSSFAIKLPKQKNKNKLFLKEQKTIVFLTALSSLMYWSSSSLQLILNPITRVFKENTDRSRVKRYSCRELCSETIWQSCWLLACGKPSKHLSTHQTGVSLVMNILTFLRRTAKAFCMLQQTPDWRAIVCFSGIFKNHLHSNILQLYLQLQEGQHGLTLT